MQMEKPDNVTGRAGGKPAAVYTLDAAGRITGWSGGAEEMTGYGSCEVAGKECSFLYDQEQAVNNSGPGYCGECFIRCRDGGLRKVLKTGSSLFNASGEITGSVEILEDPARITGFWEEVLRVRKLESLGVLAGGIAHNFNNVLTGIMASVSLARDKAGPGSEVDHILQAVESASAVAKNMAQELLIFAKGGSPVRRLMQVGPVIKEYAVLATRIKGVRCEFRIQDALAGVEADEGQLGLVIKHMVVNAVQAMPEGGVIKISAENVLLEPASEIPLKEGAYVRILIEDSGEGIPEEVLPKIFDPYFTTRDKGAGLGLAVSYSVIKKHDGHITVKSRPCGGSAFSIYLPASSIKESPGKGCPGAGEARAKGKLLVMEDEEIVRNILAIILRDMGYDAEFASEGKRAVELYLKAKESGRPFDAVILDLVVPGGMGGEATLRKILETDPGVKAVVSSGYSDDPIIADYGKYGFKAVLAKPYKARELSEVLRGLIGR